MKKLLIALTMLSLTANAEVKNKKAQQVIKTVERVKLNVSYTFSEDELQNLLSGQATVMKLTNSIQSLLKSSMKVDSVIVIDTVKVPVVDTVKDSVVVNNPTFNGPTVIGNNSIQVNK